MSGILGSELGVIKKQYVDYANSENSRILNLAEKKPLCWFHRRRLHDPVISVQCMRDEDMGWGENVRFLVNNALGALIYAFI